MPHGTEAKTHPPIVVRQPEPHDGKHLWALAGRTGLDLNSPYAYVMWSEHHRASSVVAVAGSEVVGFVMGFAIPERQGEVFVWQVAVAPELRGRRLGSTLLDELVGRTGASVVEATVTPSNEASARLFKSLAERHDGRVSVTRGYDAALFPEAHEEELRFRIDLRPPHPDGPTRVARGENHLGDL